MLQQPLLFENITIANRVVFQPMEGCDCREDGTPGELTAQKYMRAAASGAGTVWFEANAVCPEGRTNPRQMMLTEKNADAFAALLADMRKVAAKTCGIRPFFVLQLTHSGRQSMRPMIAYRNPVYEATRPVTDENVVTDEYLATLPALYAKSAALAVRVGFDAVDVKCCHGYLFQELLSAFDRPGAYGGPLENRARLYLDSIRAVKAAVPDTPVVTRLSVTDMIPRPCGFGTDEAGNLDLTEPTALVEKLTAAGIGMLNVTLGNPYYNPHVNRPFRAGAYQPPEPPQAGLARFLQVEKYLKERFPGLVVVSSGLSYYRADLMEQAERQLTDGVCDLVGFGRETLAYPEFYRDYLVGAFDAKKACVACSKCTALMRHGCVSGCAVFNEYYKKLYEEKVACKKQPL